MKRKLLAVLLSFCMVISMAPAAFAANSVFTDVNAADWFAEEVRYVFENDLMKGTADDKFDPAGSVTRAMVWTTLARLYGIDTSTGETWWQVGQEWVMETGISDGTMPHENITREQLVTMMYRYALFVGADVSVGEDTNILSYADFFDVHEWAISAMQWACGEGIITGDGENLMPRVQANRAQLAAILYRFSENVVNAPAVYTVTFMWNFDNEGVYRVVEVEEGETVGKLREPARDGYVFSGWYTAEGEAFDLDAPVNADITVYAKWRGDFVHVCEVISREVIDATCTEGGYVLVTTCCYEYKTDRTDIDPDAHDWDEYVSNNDGTHTRVCLNNEEHEETEDCSFTDNVCDFCGYTDGAVAMIGDEYYESIQAAIDASEEGDTVMLIANVNFGEITAAQIIVPNSKALTLDLNGYTVSAVDAATGSFTLIDNYGDLTITDTSAEATGKITVSAAANRGWSAQSTIIGNCNVTGGTSVRISTLTIAGGTIEHTGGSDMAFAINTSNNTGASELIISGGKVASTYRVIRMFQQPRDCAGNITVTGGEITSSGSSAIWLQEPNANDTAAHTVSTLTITGGKITGVGDAVKVSHAGTYEDAVAVITGGTFSSDPSAHVAPTHKAVENGSVWEVVERLPGEVLNTEEAQAALDAATPGTVIQLSEGVAYGTLYIRPVLNAAHTESGNWIPGNYATELARNVEDLTIIGAEGATVDKIEIVSGYKGSSYIEGAPDLMCYANINNLVIDGVEFTDNTTATDYNSPIYISLQNINLDGLTVRNCTLEGTNEKTNLVYIYSKQGNHSFETASKNITLENNTVDGIARLCELRETENVSIIGNTIMNTAEHGILLSSNTGNGYSGEIVISDNTAEGLGDRFIRMKGIKNGTEITVSDNTLEFEQTGGIIDVMKFDGGDLSACVFTVEDNTWNGYEDDMLAEIGGIWSLNLVPGTTILTVPEGQGGIIYVNSADDFLYLTELNEKWAELYSNGLGTEYDNYLTEAGGKGTPYYYKWGWTVVLTCDIDFEGDEIDPINIGKMKSFDGCGYTVANAVINGDTSVESNIALFGKVEFEIKNLILDNIHVTGGYVGNTTAGILVGTTNCAISNVVITNSSVTGGKYTGAVAGYIYGDITDCEVIGCTVLGGYKLGGIVGYICATPPSTSEVMGNVLEDCTVDGSGEFADGKTTYVIGTVVGNYNCSGECTGNTVTDVTCSSTEIIGKIEAGKTVTLD